MIERQEAWFTEPAIRIIQRLSFGLAWEFGSGMGTNWLANRCDHLTTIDDDAEWHDRVLKMIDNRKDVVALLCERPYHWQINIVEDNTLSLVIVDGRDRVKCIEASIPKLMSGGLLILDNSEREYYQRGINLMKDWNQIHCKQNRPDKYNFTYENWTTSIFIKP